jgi:uncharacterized protein
VKDHTTRAVCWKPLWNHRRQGLGLEQLLLSSRSASSVVLAFDEDAQPFCLRYELSWDEAWNLRTAGLVVQAATGTRSLQLSADGKGRWQGDSEILARLAGCVDIDIWPTPFTNSFPLWRTPLAIGERREYRMAWISTPDLSVLAQPQAYTRVAERQYRFENLDGSGFSAELTVDADGLVLDYPGFFTRVPG